MRINALPVLGEDIALDDQFAMFNTSEATEVNQTVGPTAQQILDFIAGNFGSISVTLPVHANNAAALAGGLVAGNFYRTGADPDPVCIVH